MTIQNMMDNVIKRYGHEAPVTIAFVDIATSWKSYKAIKEMYEIAMTEERFYK